MYNIENIQDSGNFLKYGLNKDLTIGSIVAFEPEIGSPYIQLELYKTDPAKDGRKFNLYMSEKARKSSLKKLLHIGTKVTDLDKLIEADKSSKTMSDFANAYSKLMTGKTIKNFMLGGEEYMNANNEKKIRTTIVLPPFADNEDTTKLKFDINNKYHYSALPIIDTVENNLPFS